MSPALQLDLIAWAASEGPDILPSMKLFCNLISRLSILESAVLLEAHDVDKLLMMPGVNSSNTYRLSSTIWHG